MYRKGTLAAAAALTLLATSCSQAGDSAGGGSDTKMAVVLKTLSSQFWGTVEDGVYAGGKDRGVNVTVQAAPDEAGIGEQADIVQSVGAQGHDCLTVAPITGTNLIQALAGVQGDRPLINVGSAVDADAASAGGVKLTTFITSDDEHAGEMAAEYIVGQLGEGGTVALVSGLEGDRGSVLRMDGFKSTAESRGLDVIQEVAADWDREKAFTAATDILQRTPDVQAFYAANDVMALGIQQAVENAGADDDIIVVGTDGNLDAVKSVDAGHLTATVSQYPYVMGEWAVDACLAALNGADLPTQVNAPLALIETRTSKEALDQYPLPFVDYDNPFETLLND